MTVQNWSPSSARTTTWETAATCVVVSISRSCSSSLFISEDAILLAIACGEGTISFSARGHDRRELQNVRYTWHDKSHLSTCGGQRIVSRLFIHDVSISAPSPHCTA